MFIGKAKADEKMKGIKYKKVSMIGIKKGVING